MFKQNNSEFRFMFNLFDGEGGDGGAGSGIGAEASAFAEEIGLSEYSQKKQPEADSKDDVTQVEYGKSSGEEAKASRVGTDTEPEQGDDLAKEFADLIGKGGKYHDIYGQRVSETVQNRLKNQADLQAQVDSMNDAFSLVYQRYGLKPGDIEGLTNAIANDDDFYQSAAEKEGVDVETYKQNLKLRADAEKGRQITEAYEMAQRQNEMFARWESEAENLKNAFPNFDLAMEIQSNEEFAKLLDGGASVETAFAATHLNELLNGFNQDATRIATENVVNTIHARSARPVENGVRNQAGIVRKSDPSKLSNDDMDEIIRRVTEEGASVSF